MRLFALTLAALFALTINPAYAVPVGFTFVEADDATDGDLDDQESFIGALQVGENTISGTLSYGRYDDCVSPLTGTDDLDFCVNTAQTTENSLIFLGEDLVDSFRVTLPEGLQVTSEDVWAQTLIQTSSSGALTYTFRLHELLCRFEDCEVDVVSANTLQETPLDDVYICSPVADTRIGSIGNIDDCLDDLTTRSWSVTLVVEEIGDPNPIPLPAAAPLLLMGLGGMAFVGRRKRRRA